MYITRDYLKQSGWVGICDLIANHTNRTVVPGSTELLDLQLINSSDVSITIKRNGSTIETYRYKRLDLSEFFRSATVLGIPNIQLPLNTYQVMTEIGRVNNITFDLEDFEIETLTTYDRTYTIKAKPTSLRFYGEMQVRLLPNLIEDISGYTKVLQPDTYALPNVNTNPKKANGIYYVTGYDFTEHRELLKVIQVDKPKPPGKKLAAILEKVTGFKFTLSTDPKEKNLYMDAVLGIPTYRVAYNGVVLPRYTNRTDIENVLVLNLSPTYCTDIVGHLLIHYN